MNLLVHGLVQQVPQPDQLLLVELVLCSRLVDLRCAQLELLTPVLLRKCKETLFAILELLLEHLDVAGWILQ